VALLDLEELPHERRVGRRDSRRASHDPRL
jgi:hypothetical protein